MSSIQVSRHVGLEAEHLCNKLLLQEIAKPWDHSMDLSAHQHPGACFAAVRVECVARNHGTC